MEQEKLKRIAIIGLPGSGKSTFATKLGKILSFPVHHLDRHMFDGKKNRDKQEFLSVKQALLKREKLWKKLACIMIQKTILITLSS